MNQKKRDMGKLPPWDKTALENKNGKIQVAQASQASLDNLHQRGLDVIEDLKRIEALPNVTEKHTSKNNPSSVNKLEPISRCFAEIEPEPVTWLWPGKIPLGKISMIAGDPGLGKSFLTLDIAARVSTGTSWPDGSENIQGNVIILSAEDDPSDTIRPRLDAAKAEVQHIYTLEAVKKYNSDGNEYECYFSLQDDLSALQELIIQTGAKLIIIDPVTAYLAGVDSHKNTDIRSVLAPLARLAGTYNCAIICVSHLNKGGTSAQYRVMGSLAFTAATRSVFIVTKDQDDDTRRLIIPLKNNLAPDNDGMAYKIALDEKAHPCVAWETEPVKVKLSEALDCHPGPDATERQEAKQWLRELLENGKMKAADIKKQSIADGFSWATVHRAKNEIGVIAKREGGTGKSGRWIWSLRYQSDSTPLETEILEKTRNLRQNESETPISDDSKRTNSAKIPNYRERNLSGEATETPSKIDWYNDLEAPF